MSAESSSSSAKQSFSVRLPQSQNPDKSYNLMKFAGSLGVDPANWNKLSVEMVREDNRRVYESGKDMPEFGAGSEFGKQARDDARRKRRGYQAARYKHHNQAWHLTGEDGRVYRGMRDGGAGENADYWIFVKTSEGVFEAHHISDWYQFRPVARHKTLDIDEAEEQFKTRNRVMNTFALKASLHGGEETEVKEEVKSDTKRNASFKISDRDEYSSGGSDEDELVEVKQEKDSDGEEKPKKKGKKNVKKVDKKKTKKVKVEEAEEVASGESDDGDEEGREVADYISDSGSEPDVEDTGTLEDKVEGALVGVDAERGLRTLLSDNEDDDDDDAPKTKIPGTSSDSKNKGSDSDSGSDSDDPDEKEIKSAVFLQEKQLLGDADPTGSKRPAPADSEDGPSAKKSRRSGDSMEREVIRYLQRDKMTTKELIAKLKKKGESLSKEAKGQLVQRLAAILKTVESEFGTRFEKIQQNEPGKEKKTWYFHIKPL